MTKTKVVNLHDKKRIEDFMRQNVFLNIYAIGDLDDFFWDYTIWFGLEEENLLKAVILLYTGMDMPCCLVLSDENIFMERLLSSVLHLLPGSFYCHITPGLEKPFSEKFILEHHGLHYKMSLTDKEKLKNIDTSSAFQLTEKDTEEINILFRESYPGNWFDPRMLLTGQYYGIAENGKLLTIAGIHVYSEQKRVAALGNITTHPDFRGKGLAKAVTAKLCKSLLNKVDSVGLNVKADNKPAISCYEKLGFEITASYNEIMISR